MAKAIISWKPRRALLAGLACVALFAATLAPALAAPGAADPTPTPPAASAADASARLEKAFQREKTALERQQKTLAKTSNLAARMQTRLDDRKAKGQDVVQAQAALDAYKKAMSSAQLSYNAAKAALDARSGFDANGKVTDAAAAAKTVEAARTALRDFRAGLMKAGRDLRAAMGKVRQGFRLKAEQQGLASLQKGLAGAGTLSTKAQQFITRQKGAGKDTSKLESALTAFKTTVATAQQGFDRAQGLLKSPGGFDAGGQVTDPARARTALQDARQALQTARQALRQGTATLRQAMRDFRSANPAKTAKTP